MSIGAIAGPQGNVPEILNNALQKVGLTPDTAGGPPPVDTSQLSPLGQVLSTLQQLPQSNPSEYKQVTQQVAASLQAAAQVAQSSGNTNFASQLTQLSSDFTNAAATGLLPNIADLAQAVSGSSEVGGGGHHHHAHAATATPGSTPTQASTQDPLSIIQNALGNS